MILFLDLPSNTGGSFQLPEGTPEVLHLNFPVSLRRSSTYFLWKIKMPCLEHTISIPRKKAFLTSNYCKFQPKWVAKESITLTGKCFLKIYSISLCIPFSNQPSFVSIKGPIRFTLHSDLTSHDVDYKSGQRQHTQRHDLYKPPYSLATPIVLLVYSPQLLFVKSFPSKVDPFVELIDPFVKPFPITKANPVLELPLSSMTNRRSYRLTLPLVFILIKFYLMNLEGSKKFFHGKLFQMVYIDVEKRVIVLHGEGYMLNPKRSSSDTNLNEKYTQEEELNYRY
ncbi:hypothetical protein CR513_30241, partial [Mucuna pruriens]